MVTDSAASPLPATAPATQFDLTTTLHDLAADAVLESVLAAFYDGHPTIRVPKIVPELCTRRVITSELATDLARVGGLSAVSTPDLLLLAGLVVFSPATFLPVRLPVSS